MKVINEEFICYEDYPKKVRKDLNLIIVKGKLNIHTDEGVFSSSFKPFDLVQQDLIRDGCLDKQKVKEAIMRLPNDNRRYILLKELKLE